MGSQRTNKIRFLSLISIAFFCFCKISNSTLVTKYPEPTNQIAYFFDKTSSNKLPVPEQINKIINMAATDNQFNSGETQIVEQCVRMEAELGSTDATNSVGNHISMTDLVSGSQTILKNNLPGETIEIGFEVVLSSKDKKKLRTRATDPMDRTIENTSATTDLSTPSGSGSSSQIAIEEVELLENSANPGSTMTGCALPPTNTQDDHQNEISSNEHDTIKQKKSGAKRKAGDELESDQKTTNQSRELTKNQFEIFGAEHQTFLINGIKKFYLTGVEEILEHINTKFNNDAQILFNLSQHPTQLRSEAVAAAMRAGVSMGNESLDIAFIHETARQSLEMQTRELYPDHVHQIVYAIEEKFNNDSCAIFQLTLSHLETSMEINGAATKLTEVGQISSTMQISDASERQEEAQINNIGISGDHISADSPNSESGKRDGTLSNPTEATDHEMECDKPARGADHLLKWLTKQGMSNPNAVMARMYKAFGNLEVWMKTVDDDGMRRGVSSVLNNRVSADLVAGEKDLPIELSTLQLGNRLANDRKNETGMDVEMPKGPTQPAATGGGGIRMGGPGEVTGRGFSTAFSLLGLNPETTSAKTTAGTGFVVSADALKRGGLTQGSRKQSGAPLRYDSTLEGEVSQLQLNPGDSTIAGSRHRLLQNKIGDETSGLIGMTVSGFMIWKDTAINTGKHKSTEVQRDEAIDHIRILLNDKKVPRSVCDYATQINTVFSAPNFPNNCIDLHENEDAWHFSLLIMFNRPISSAEFPRIHQAIFGSVAAKFGTVAYCQQYAVSYHTAQDPTPAASDYLAVNISWISRNALISKYMVKFLRACLYREGVSQTDARTATQIHYKRVLYGNSYELWAAFSVASISIYTAGISVDSQLAAKIRHLFGATPVPKMTFILGYEVAICSKHPELKHRVPTSQQVAIYEYSNVRVPFEHMAEFTASHFGDNAAILITLQRSSPEDPYIHQIFVRDPTHTLMDPFDCAELGYEGEEVGVMIKSDPGLQHYATVTANRLKPITKQPSPAARQQSLPSHPPTPQAPYNLSTPSPNPRNRYAFQAAARTASETTPPAQVRSYAGALSPMANQIMPSHGAALQQQVTSPGHSFEQELDDPRNKAMLNNFIQAITSNLEVSFNAQQAAQEANFNAQIADIRDSQLEAQQRQQEANHRQQEADQRQREADQRSLTALCEFDTRLSQQAARTSADLLSMSSGIQEMLAIMRLQQPQQPNPQQIAPTDPSATPGLGYSK
jgi:hypothetical protein